MGGMTITEKYNCGEDCDFGSGCCGHMAKMSYRTSSDFYTVKFNDSEGMYFSVPQMRVLMQMAKSMSEEGFGLDRDDWADKV